MTKEREAKLKILVDLLKTGKITPDEFTLLIEIEKEKEYVYLPGYPFKYYDYYPDWTYRPWAQPYYTNQPFVTYTGTDITTCDGTTTVTYDSAFNGAVNSSVN